MSTLGAPRRMACAAHRRLLIPLRVLHEMDAARRALPVELHLTQHRQREVALTALLDIDLATALDGRQPACRRLDRRRLAQRRGALGPRRLACRGAEVAGGVAPRRMHRRLAPRLCQSATQGREGDVEEMEMEMRVVSADGHACMHLI